MNISLNYPLTAYTNKAEITVKANSMRMYNIRYKRLIEHYTTLVKFLITNKRVVLTLNDKVRS